MSCAGYIFKNNNNETYLQSERNIEKGIPEEEMTQNEKLQILYHDYENFDNNLYKKKQDKGKSVYNFLNQTFNIDFENVFDTLDMDNDDVISIDELQILLRKNNCPSTVINDVPNVIKRVSMDSTDKLTRNDFKNLI